MNKLIIDGNIYSEHIVKKAIKDYSMVAQIRLEVQNNNIICVFDSSEYNMDKTMKEFENYIIDLSNSSRDFDYDN